VETDGYLPLYDETARIVTLGRLYHTSTNVPISTAPATTPTTTTTSYTRSTQTTNTNTNTITSTNKANTNTNTTSTDTIISTNTASTSTYPYINPYLTHDDEDYPEPGVLAGQLVFFNALSRADAIRYLPYFILST